MKVVTEHFERVTGRPFYGLAAKMHSVPDWGTTYHAGGRIIERWAVDVPGATTLLLLLISATVVVLVERKHWRPARVVLCVIWHLAVAAAFFCIMFWFSINVTGLFI